MKKVDITESMTTIHDGIKEHPFRVSFNDRYIRSYKDILYKLSEKWSDLIYKCDDTSEEEKKQLYHFGDWIHNYRQELRTYDKEHFPMRLLDYYERMIQVTHNYIDRGDLSVYYKIDYFSKDGTRYNEVEKYIFVTSEMCGIDSPELPRYYPVGRKMCVDDDKVKLYIDKCSAFRYKSNEERETILSDWRINVKPILIWINENANADDYMHDVWQSL